MAMIYDQKFSFMSLQNISPVTLFFHRPIIAKVRYMFCPSSGDGTNQKNNKKKKNMAGVTPLSTITEEREEEEEQEE